MKSNPIKFTKAGISGIVTFVGDKKIDFLESYKSFSLNEREANRLAKTIGLGTRYIVSGDETTADLCFNAANKLLSGLNVSADSIGGLIFVSQTPDYSSPATAIHLQERLGIRNSSICFDMRLGCSGFVYGLAVAYSFIEAGVDKMLLCVGDVASKIVNQSDHVVAALMGDAGSAILIEKKNSKSLFNLFSDGSGYDALIIPNSGLRKDVRFDGLEPFIQMNGAAVFDFTLKRIPDLISSTLTAAGTTTDEIDMFVMHQPNKYILKNINNRLNIPLEKLPHATQSIYGNQNSASIPGTINGFLSDRYSGEALQSVFAGFGIGLSWGSCVITTSNIFSPNTFILGEGNE